MGGCVEGGGEVIGIEEGMCWLPSHLLQEALLSTTIKDHRNKPPPNHHHHRYRPSERPPQSQSKSISRHRNKSKYCGGSGMQAFFLDSAQTSCGTGVFLPPRSPTNFQSIKKPVCSPVLLPSRVVHALNLNVHALGLQLSPRRVFEENKRNSKNNEECNNLTRSKNEGEISTKFCTSFQVQSSQDEIYLPKEWTY